MSRRSVLALALVVVSVASLATVTRLYLLADASGPRLVAAPAPPPSTFRTAFPTTTRTVPIKRGDNLVAALARDGLAARAAAGRAPGRPLPPAGREALRGRRLRGLRAHRGGAVRLGGADALGRRVRGRRRALGLL